MNPQISKSTHDGTSGTKKNDESPLQVQSSRYFAYIRPFVKNVRSIKEILRNGRVGGFVFSKLATKTATTPRFVERLLVKIGSNKRITGGVVMRTFSTRIAPKLAHYFPEVYKSVAHAAIDVKGSYLLTVLYIFLDTAYALWCAHSENKIIEGNNNNNNSTASGAILVVGNGDKNENQESPIGQIETSADDNELKKVTGHHRHQHSLLKLTAEKLTFHFAASLVLPVVVLDGVAHYSAHYLFPKIWKPTTSFRNANINKFGPSMLSLCMIPLLPFVIDEPVEYLVGKIFGKEEEEK